MRTNNAADRGGYVQNVDRTSWKMRGCFIVEKIHISWFLISSSIYPPFRCWGRCFKISKFPDRNSASCWEQRRCFLCLHDIGMSVESIYQFMVGTLVQPLQFLWIPLQGRLSQKTMSSEVNRLYPRLQLFRCRYLCRICVRLAWSDCVLATFILQLSLLQCGTDA